MPGNLFSRMGPLQRVAVSFTLTLLTFLLVINTRIDNLVHAILLWDVFSLSYIINSWILIFNRNFLQIREYARKEDGSSFFVFMFILISSVTGLTIAVLLVLSPQTSHLNEGYWPMAVSGIVLSWFIVHTTFTFHYAHLYYGDNKQDKNVHAGGLNFPNDKLPDYRDFAYYAFVIGMTFQVSDVSITSKHFRRITLAHGLLSFALNTAVVALTVNILAGLKK